MFQFWLNIIHMFLCGLIRPLHGAMIKGHEDPLVNVMRWRFARKDQRIRPSINRKPMSTSSNIFCLGLQRTFNLLENILLPRVLRSCHSALTGLTFSWQEMGGWVQDEDWGYLYKNTLEEYTVICRLQGWYEFKMGKWLRQYNMSTWVYADFMSVLTFLEGDWLTHNYISTRMQL